MKPLFVLIGTFVLSYLAFFIITHNANVYNSGRIAMAAMLVFTSVAHFVFNKGMTLMLPQWMPFKKMIIYLTGIIEIALGIGLVIPLVSYIDGLLLIDFFILLLPANILAANQKVDLEKATYDGNGLSYLWFRVPLQLFFIAWVWYFAVFH
jgi:uncharacterized membrane protein